MTLLVTGSQIIGLPVVTLDAGEDVAEVRDVLFDPSRGSLRGVTLNKRGRFAGRLRELLPVEQIHAVGRDALIILTEDALTLPTDAPAELAEVDEQRNVLGNDVLTESGVSLGTVRDIAIVVGSHGVVVGYQVDTVDGRTGYVPFPLQLAISGSTLLVPDVTADYLRDDLAGLGSVVAEYRDKLMTA